MYMIGIILFLSLCFSVVRNEKIIDGVYHPYISPSSEDYFQDIFDPAQDTQKKNEQPLGRTAREKLSCKRGSENVCVTPACVHTASKIIKKMDQKQNPCEDFYKFACDGWVKEQILKLDEDHLYYGININEMPEEADNILERLVTKKLPLRDRSLYETTPYQNVQKLYDSCMNEELIRKEGIQPVVDFFKTLKAYQIEKPFDESLWDLEAALAEMFSIHGTPILEISIDTNYTSSSKWGIVVTSPKHSGILPALVSPMGRKEYLNSRSWSRQNEMKKSTVYSVLRVLSRNSRMQMIKGGDQLSSRNMDQIENESSPNSVLWDVADTKREEFWEKESEATTTIPEEPTANSSSAQDPENLFASFFDLPLQLPTMPRSQFYRILQEKGNEEQIKLTIPFLENLWKSALGAENNLIKATTTMSISSESLVQKITAFMLQLKEIEPTDQEETLHIQYAKLYNFYTVDELQQHFPMFQWSRLLNQIFKRNLPVDTTVTVHFPEHLRRLSNILSKTEPWVIHYGLLSFYAYDSLKNLVEIDESESRENFCFLVVRETFPEVLSNMYMNFVGKKRLHFVQREMSPMIQSLTKEFEKLIKQSWMSKRDQALAIDKVKNLDWQIGGTESYFNITAIVDVHENYTINNISFFDNVVEIFKTSRESIYGIYGSDVDPEGLIWTVSAKPYVVNAFYLQSENAIVIPSAFIIPPYFYPDSAPYVNYGGIGVALGHELFHTIDYSGVLFDKHGDLTQPFSSEVKHIFQKNLQCFNNLSAESFTEVFDLEGLSISLDIDPVMTMNENFADILGLKTSYNAYKTYSEKIAGSIDVLPGQSLSPDQLFFISFAQPYCSILPGLAKVILMEIDEHLPHDIRMNSLLKNFPQFSQAFHCKPSDKMFSKEECPLL